MAKDDNDILLDVQSHYDMWTEDNDVRTYRKYGWNDITDAYYGRLPSDWPFTSKTVDPRIRTSILEKNARLVNGKLRGRLVPREGGDVLKAEINNAILDYQWDSATDGGSMNLKISLSDLDTRLYNSKFALVKWRCVYGKDGKIEFEGNEMKPLDIRDCGMDPASSHIRDAKWFQHRSWEYFGDLFSETDVNGDPAFKNIAELKRLLKSKQSGKSARRDTTRESRGKQLKGMTDRVGEDTSFPVIEIVTEYRTDRWITFAPEHNLILRDIKNPYIHRKIPVVQLRYYTIQDDPLGESEVEPLIPLWLAIQATVCGYMDEVILKMRPPLKIINGAVQIETIEYSAEAQWLMDRPDAVTEMQSNGEAIRYFQTTYSALVSAFNTAAGDMSQGTSGVDPFNPEKTATEIRATQKQQNVRDQKNQNDLSDFIADIMLMWLSNNKQFLFSNPKKHEYILRIVGKEKYDKFVGAGLMDTYLPPEVISQLQDLIDMNPDMSPEELNMLASKGSLPKYTVVENPKDPEEKWRVKPKMKISEVGDVADVYVTPEDMEGVYDYIADVKSMSAGYTIELANARQQALTLFTTNPNYLNLLAQEGYRPKVKELTVETFNELGLNDSDRFFDKLPQQPILNGQQTQDPQAGTPQMGGPQPNGQVGRVSPLPQANPGAGPQ